MEKLLENKKLIIVIAVAAILVCAIAVFLNSGDVCGAWEVAERSAGENLDDYPEENLVIYEDGTFTCDGVGGTYSMNDDTITLNLSLFGSYTYEYDVSGNTLTLKNIDDEDASVIYYDRVS